jgi:hypothetical protein
VLGGGNVKHLKVLPKDCRPGDNANAFVGGFRLWIENEKADKQPSSGKRLGPHDLGRHANPYN